MIVISYNDVSPLLGPSIRWQASVFGANQAIR